MTYDAVAVARRGLGQPEVDLMSPTMAAAVRWAMYVDKAYEPVPELERIAAVDPPNSGLTGPQRMSFIANRNKAREMLKATREAIMLDDDG
jgi:hypothetical protein